MVTRKPCSTSVPGEMQAQGVQKHPTSAPQFWAPKANEALRVSDAPFKPPCCLVVASRPQAPACPSSALHHRLPSRPFRSTLQVETPRTHLHRGQPETGAGLASHLCAPHSGLKDQQGPNKPARTCTEGRRNWRRMRAMRLMPRQSCSSQAQLALWQLTQVTTTATAGTAPACSCGSAKSRMAHRDTGTCFGTTSPPLPRLAPRLHACAGQQVAQGLWRRLNTLLWGDGGPQSG